jgi:hypothetical protein
MDYSFSINLYDSEGDKFQDGIFIYIGENTIVKFKDLQELEAFSENLSLSLEEIERLFGRG